MILKQHDNGRWTAVARMRGKRFLAEGGTRAGARAEVTIMIREALRGQNNDRRE